MHYTDLHHLENSIFGGAEKNVFVVIELTPVSLPLAHCSVLILPP